MKPLDISKLSKPSVRGLRAYEAKEVPCRVKLDANESPFDPGIGILDGLRSIQANRYPDPEAKALRRVIARRFRVRPENILQGNGSDELIYYLVTAFGGPVLFPVPTFSMYGIISRALGEKTISVPLDREFDLDIDRTLRAIKRERPKLVFLSSPNNPTGNCFSADRILKVIRACRGLVVVDEAYQPFSSQRGFMPLLGDYPNLVILRTLSKIGLAALRLGFLIADPAVAGEVNKVRLPFNVNALSQASAVAALSKPLGIQRAICTITAGREQLFKDMSSLPGVVAYPSEANFILFKVKDAGRVYRSLLKKGVLVRNLNEGLPGCLRVTVGTPGENKTFLKALRDIVS